MKPKDLKPPFSFENRSIICKEGVLYVPTYYANYEEWTFPGWEALFGNSHPVHVEFCSGNGDWIIHQAKKEPEKNWVAIEKRFDRVRKIWSKRENEGITNLFIVCGEGLTISSNYFPNQSIQQVFVNFPDPWPKKRHAKHRIINPSFVEEMSRALLPQGIFTLVTDDPDYCQIMIETVSQQGSFSPCLPFPFYRCEPGEYGPSYFDTLWRKLGRTIHYIEYKRNG